MDIRLDLERVKQIQRIASQLSWLECAHCGLLSTDLDLMRVDKPCPNCKVADTRRGFPSLYAIMYCDMVREAFATEHYEATVVLTCALLEALLEELLAGIMHSEQVPPHIIEAMFEGFQGIRRRERLFRHLTGRKLQQAIDSLQLNLPSFYKDWLSSDSGIVKIRNDFLHGQRPQIGKSHGDKAFRLALFSFEVFARLSNEFRLHPG